MPATQHDAYTEARRSLKKAQRRLDTAESEVRYDHDRRRFTGTNKLETAQRNFEAAYAALNAVTA